LEETASLAWGETPVRDAAVDDVRTVGGALEDPYTIPSITWLVPDVGIEPTRLEHALLCRHDSPVNEGGDFYV